MKKLQGLVISTKMAHTAVVKVERWVVDPLYKKRLRRSKNYHADNAVGVVVGETVMMQETRPLSKTKRWKIVEVVNKPGVTKLQSTTERGKRAVARRRPAVNKRT